MTHEKNTPPNTKPYPADNKTLTGKDYVVQEGEEIGGTQNDIPEPTRYGDWEKGGRCTDF